MGHFQDSGFQIVRSQVPKVLCDALVELFKEEVKPFQGELGRFGEGPGPNRFDDGDRLDNPIKNMHDLDSRVFPGFTYAARLFYEHAGLQERAESFAREPLDVETGFFFEKGRGTSAHQDRYFNQKVHKAVAAFVALQDIERADGPLFVCPGSHKKEIVWPFSEQAYIDSLAEMVAQGELKRYAPSLKKGDVVFFDGELVHGSFTGGKGTTRYTMTAHYVPKGTAGKL